MQQELSTAHQHRKEFKQRATLERMEARNELANAKAEAEDKSAAHYLRELNTVEEIRRLFATIKAVEGRLGTGSTTQVQVPQPNGDQIL